MVHRGPVALDLKPFEQVSREMRDKLGPTIGDGVDREAVELPNVPVVQLSSLIRRDIRSSGDKVSHFRKAVNTHKDRVIPVRGWQFDDEVHRDRLPRPSGNKERLEIAKGSAAWDFIAYTGLAGVDVLIDKLSHPRPIEVSFQQFQSLLLSQMPSSFGVMVFLKDISLYLVDSRNIHASFVQDHSVRVRGERLEIWRILIASR